MAVRYSNDDRHKNDNTVIGEHGIFTHGKIASKYFVDHRETM